MSGETSTATPRRLNRETILLGIVVLTGLAGLIVLQVSRNRPEAGAGQKSLLQSASTVNETPAGQQRSIQQVSGNLLNVNDDSEAGKPYVFRMTNHAKGAVYELDPGDGTGRKPFDENGAIQHTYQKAGNYTVRLHARYEGEEAVLQTIVHKVGQPIQVEAPIRKEKKTLIIDY